MTADMDVRKDMVLYIPPSNTPDRLIMTIVTEWRINLFDIMAISGRCIRHYTFLQRYIAEPPMLQRAWGPHACNAMGFSFYRTRKKMWPIAQQGLALTNPGCILHDFLVTCGALAVTIRY